MLFKSLIPLAFSAISVLAAPRLARRDLPSGDVTCGSNDYDVSAIEDAINAGVQDMESGDLPGGIYYESLLIACLIFLVILRQLSSPILSVRIDYDHEEVTGDHLPIIVRPLSTSPSSAIVMVPGLRYASGYFSDPFT
jgi:hypothetical protein